MTSLPLELQYNIVAHFSTMADFVRFGTICKAWRTLQQSDYFWKIVAQKIGIQLPKEANAQLWVIEEYLLTHRVFQVMSEPHPTDFQTIVGDPAVPRHFRSLAQLQQDTLKAFFRTFHAVFQATSHFRKEMIQDLFDQKPQIIFRVCRDAIFFNFLDKDLLQLNGSIAVRIQDLNDKESAFLSEAIAQNRPMCQAVIPILNRRLFPLEKMIDCMSAEWQVQEPFDPKNKSIDFTLPWGLYLATRPIDVGVSLTYLEEEAAFKSSFVLDIRPYQRLILIDIPDEIGNFLNVVQQSLLPEKWDQMWDLIDTCFQTHRLKLTLRGGLIMDYDHMSGMLVLCSDGQIQISKLPIKSK